MNLAGIAGCLQAPRVHVSPGSHRRHRECRLHLSLSAHGPGTQGTKLGGRPLLYGTVDISDGWSNTRCSPSPRKSPSEIAAFHVLLSRCYSVFQGPHTQCTTLRVENQYWTRVNGRGSRPAGCRSHQIRHVRTVARPVCHVKPRRHTERYVDWVHAKSCNGVPRTRC